MPKRLWLLTCLSLVLICGLSATNRADAQEPPAHPKNDVLERFVGVWDLKSTLKPAKWNPDGGEITVKESTVWALKNRVIVTHDMSHPDGTKRLYITTHDVERDAYLFWCFDSNGLPGAQWLLKWNAESNTTFGRATDTPPAWTSGVQDRFPDGNTILNSIWMRDENGTLLMDVTGRKHRLPADREAAIVAAWKKHEPADLPAELKVFDRMIGTWDTVTVQKPAEWTPDGGRSTATVTRNWILNGRFVMDTSLHSNGEEGISIIGYDPGQKVYRSWWFNSLGHRNDSRGQWNAATNTLSYRTELEDGKSMQSSVRFADANKEVWQFKATDTAGKVYLDMEIAATRKK